MNKTEFLGLISERLGRPTPTVAPSRDVVGVPEFWSSMKMSESDRMARFSKCLVDLGAEVHVVSDVEALRAKLTEVLGALRPNLLGIWNDAQLKDWVEPTLQPYEVVTWGVDARERFTNTDVGITGCTFAIADTGTVVLSCGGGKGRSVHLLPSVHVAIVKKSQLRDRLGEALQELPVKNMDSYVHFVTGPSRSSDIENDQSIGVHGPAAEVVFIVENL